MKKMRERRSEEVETVEKEVGKRSKDKRSFEEEEER